MNYYIPLWKNFIFWSDKSIYIFCGRADSETAVRTALVWFITEYIIACIQGPYTVYKGARVQGAVANWFDR